MQAPAIKLRRYSAAIFFMFVAVVAASLVAASDTNPAAERPPNIVIMMADDMGYSDIGCYGGEIETPALDALAANGVRFRQFYNGARCCSTRAALLTGLYAHQAGVGHMMRDQGLDGYRGDLNRHCLTIAQVLGRSGYSTYMSGKWHVTKKIGPDLTAEDQHNWPRQRGFDRFFGTIHGAGSFYDPNSLARNNRLITPGSDDFYYTDAIAQNAVQFIGEHDDRQPFFLYVAFTAPHWPMHAKPRDIAKYHGRYNRGWDALREERYRRMQAMGVIDSQWQLSARIEGAPAWEDEPNQVWAAQRMEVYAAMVDCMDQAVGRIVGELRATQQLDNTLIFFLADNGGCAEEFGTGRGNAAVHLSSQPHPDGAMRPGELQTKMAPERTRDGRVVRRGRGVVPGPADTYIAYGREWANASNTPFRRFKHWVHEGGISSPLVVHWPSGIDPQRASQWEDQPAHLIDLMATCVDVARADYPSQDQDHAIHALRGVSLRPALQGNDLERPDPLFWEHEGNRAVRDGRWKLVAKGPRGTWELYDMQSDRTETTDVAAQHPRRVERLAAAWQTWAESCHVTPWPWK